MYCLLLALLCPANWPEFTIWLGYGLVSLSARRSIDYYARGNRNMYHARGLGAGQ